MASRRSRKRQHRRERRKANARPWKAQKSAMGKVGHGASGNEVVGHHQINSGVRLERNPEAFEVLGHHEAVGGDAPSQWENVAQPGSNPGPRTNHLEASP